MVFDKEFSHKLQLQLKVESTMLFLKYVAYSIVY